MMTRVITVEDLPVLVELTSQLRDSDTSMTVTAESLAYFLGSDERAIICVSDENELVLAMAVLNLVYKLPRIECRIDEVVVRESSRGRGVGFKLLQACEEWAWDHQADVVELTSRPAREAANHLYQKLGYTLRETNVYHKLRTR